MVWKLLAAALITAVSALLVRQIKPEFAIFVQLGGTALIALFLLEAVQDLISALKSLEQFAPVATDGSLFILPLKALGICITTQFAADICRDSGSQALANIVELGGRLLILALTLPLLKNLAELSVGLIAG